MGLPDEMRREEDINLVLLNALNHVASHIKHFPDQPLDRGCRRVVLDAVKAWEQAHGATG